MNKADGQVTRDPPLRNSCELPAHSGEDGRSGAESVPKPHAVPQAVPNRGRRNPGSYAETAIAGKSSLSTGAYWNVGHGRRFGRQLQFIRGVHSRFPKSISDFSQHLPAHA